jgi:hypothetical protein
MSLKEDKIRARGIDLMFSRVMRGVAQGHLRDAQQAADRAEWHFDLAARELQEAGPHAERLALEWFDLAMRGIESARFYRTLAKGDLLLATRGTPLDCWSAEHRRAHRLEREAWIARVSA